MHRMTAVWPALVILVTAGAGLPGPLQAQAPNGQLPPELLACAGETDVGRRLECFDREMAKLQDTAEPDPAPAAAEVADPPPDPEPAVVAESVPEAPVATPEPASTPAVTATESTPANAPETSDTTSDNFGLADPEPEQISAVVTDIAHRPYGEFVVLLDNGQIWEQKHRDSRFRIDIGDQVTISEGLVSGFRLSAGGRNNSVQVERLK